MEDVMKIVDTSMQAIVKPSTSLPKETIKKSAYGLEMLNVNEFWKKGYFGEGVKIAVLDSGCDFDNIYLRDRIILGKNFTKDDNSDENIFKDYNGHGTHVAGIIGSSALGVAPKCELIILKVVQGNGTGSIESFLRAFRFAIEEKVDIISISLGSPNEVEEIHDSIKIANSLGISVVCAAGNLGDGNSDTDELLYPSAYNEVISVGAVDNNKSIANFTNSNKEVDVVAPGVNILSTFLENRFAFLTGTSMSAPFVTGVIALIIEWSKVEFGRRFTEDEIYSELIKNTVSLEAPRTFQGKGLVYCSLR